MRDVRLSTGGTMSARFPVLTPNGTIIDADGENIDHVVDGGYFENFGATSAHELAEALECYGLKPFVILVKNEPTTARTDCVNNGQLEYETSVTSRWFSVITSPLAALYQTRNARGTQAATQLFQGSGQQLCHHFCGRLKTHTKSSR